MGLIFKNPIETITNLAIGIREQLKRENINCELEKTAKSDYIFTINENKHILKLGEIYYKEQEPFFKIESDSEFLSERIRQFTNVEEIENNKFIVIE